TRRSSDLGSESERFGWCHRVSRRTQIRDQGAASPAQDQTLAAALQSEPIETRMWSGSAREAPLMSVPLGGVGPDETDSCDALTVSESPSSLGSDSELPGHRVFCLAVVTIYGLSGSSRPLIGCSNGIVVESLFALGPSQCSTHELNHS